MKILVVDGNLVYAKQVKKALESMLQTVEVSIATNVWQVDRRLTMEGPFALILIDLLAAIDPDSMLAKLNEVTTPKIVWSVVPALPVLRKSEAEGFSKVIHKPSTFELRATIAQEVIPAMSGVL